MSLCTCGGQRCAWWGLKPEVPIVQESFSGQYVFRGDSDIIRRGFALDVPLGAELWDAAQFCTACQQTAPSGPGVDPYALHLSGEHIFLSSGKGKLWLEGGAERGRRQILPTLSVTPSAFISFKVCSGRGAA